MLATLADRPFAEDGWVYERKLDGIRCLAFRDGPDVRLLSRKRQPLTNTYPEIAQLIAAQEASDFVIDGEVVAFEGRRTSFAKLQQRSGVRDPLRARLADVEVFYYVFDLLHIDEYDTRSLPLTARKQLLRRTISFGGHLRLTVHRKGNGQDRLAAACKAGWEGLIAKKADSGYSSRRSTAWLKLKCSQDQELVVGGFTEPSGSRMGFGALLVGYYDHGKLVYAGKVGTGFDDKLLRELRTRMNDIERASPPFAGTRRFDRGTHFVEPNLVVEIGFTEWTRDGMLRHPRFLGLRDDKAALEVTRETPSRRAAGSPHSVMKTPNAGL